MARGINKVILVGNLGGDPDVKYTQGGVCVCTLSVATSEKWKDKATGQDQERTEWHRVKLWGRLGEIAGEYLKKGRQVYIEGSIRTSKFTDKDGVQRYSTDIVGNEMQMLGGGSDDRERAPVRGNPRRPEPQAARSAAVPMDAREFEDDDIPF